MSRTANVRRVLLIVLVLNVAITLVKLGIGFATGALSVIADGFHSVVDSSSNIIGLAGLWLASRPADDNHPYGHRKYENIATLAIGAMLLVVSWEIIKGIVSRLSSTTVPNISPLDIGLMAGTFVVNLAIVAYETNQGRAHKSDLLLADAAHTRTDLFVTLSVIGSLVAARLGMAWVDLLVAGAVVVLIVQVALGILKRTSQILTDALVINPDIIERTASSVPGVHFAHRARSRGSQEAAYVDVHVKVDPAMSTTQAHAIASEVERRLLSEVAGIVDAVVHIEPVLYPIASAWDDINVRVRAEADGMGVGIHDVRVHEEQEGGYTIEMHVEIPAHLTLGEAHDLATGLEQRILTAMPRITAITTHLEPIPVAVPDEGGSTGQHLAKLRRLVETVANTVAGEGSAHEVQLHVIDGYITASVHITLPATQPLTEAHALSEEVDRRILENIPSIKRVAVHVEPPDSHAS